jgi:hypothetical protein
MSSATSENSNRKEAEGDVRYTAQELEKVLRDLDVHTTGPGSRFIPPYETFMGPWQKSCPQCKQQGEPSAALKGFGRQHFPYTCDKGHYWLPFSGGVILQGKKKDATIGMTQVSLKEYFGARYLEYLKKVACLQFESCKKTVDKLAAKLEKKRSALSIIAALRKDDPVSASATAAKSEDKGGESSQEEEEEEGNPPPKKRSRK